MTKFFCILLLVFAFTGGSLAQRSAGGNELLSDQAWLVKTLQENGTYSDIGSETLISEVRFTGCQLNLVTERTGSAGGWKITTTLSFDLTNIDAKDISDIRSDSRKMRILVLRTIDGEDVVSYHTRSRHLAESSRMGRTAVITVRKKRTKEIKDKLIATIAACQVKGSRTN